MELRDIIPSVDGFASWSHADKIKLFAWFLHTHKNQIHFTAAQIEKCFLELNVSPPSLVAPFLFAMERRTPKEALKDASGYRLESSIRARFDSKYGQRAATVYVHKLLSELPDKISGLAGKAYLEEALVCFRHKAFRAAVVMCWNLAFDVLCTFVFQKHLADFNSQLPRSFPKVEIALIRTKDDFGILKEAQVLQICKSANIISAGLYKILKEKLDRRNLAAHPSDVIISEPTAEEFIKDLIENVVLKLNLPSLPGGAVSTTLPT